MKKNYLLVWMIMVGFFVVSFVTNILGPIMPEAIKDLNLSLVQAGILPFAFFIAYAISIPAGYALERYGSKFLIILAFIIGTCGSMVFAVFPSYITYLATQFIVGISVAMLQVAFWPLLRTSGGEENYSFNSVLTQIFFGAASFISPLVYSYLILNLPYKGSSNILLMILTKIVPDKMTWVSIYWINAIVILAMIFFIAMIKFPKVELNEDEKFEGLSTIINLLSNKVVVIYFVGIFAYVGMEQGISVWMSKFLQDYHGYNANTTGAHAVAMFWALQSIGSLLGIVLLKLFDVKAILKTFLIGQFIALSAALFGPAQIALIAFPVTGFLTSVMYGSVFSLGMNSLKTHHGSVSGIFCTGIIGGAVVPLFVGLLGEYSGLRIGMCFVYFTILYMMYIALTAKPLVNNKTIKISELFKVKSDS